MKGLLITWNDANNLDIPIIDEQHRGVVADINSIFYALGTTNNHELVAKMVEIIILVTETHFAVEEELLERAGYPNHQAHKDEHAMLSRQLNSLALIDQITADPMGFLVFLKDWWLDHINCADQEYAPFVRAFLAKEA